MVKYYLTKAGVKFLNEMHEDRKPLKRYTTPKEPYSDPLNDRGEPFGRTVFTGLGDLPRGLKDRMIASEKGMTPAQIKIMNAIKAKNQAAQHDTLQRVHPSKVTRTRKTSFENLPKNPDVFFPGFGRWEEK